jgi:hypothetical protein
MPQLTSIVVDDASGDDRTFQPREIAAGVATLVESTGVPVGDGRLKIGRSRSASGREKVTVSLQMPVIQDMVVNGISKPTAVRTAYADLTLTFDGTSATAERNDVRVVLANLLNTSVMDDVISNLAYLY